VVVARAGKGVLQIALAAVSVVFSWSVAGGSWPNGGAHDPLMAVFLTAVAVRGLIFWPFGLYGGLWRYASVRELTQILLAAGAGSILTSLAVGALGRLHDVPDGFFVIDAMAIVFLLGGVRVLSRVRRGSAHPRRRVLVIGAGDAGAMILREMLHRSDSPYQPVGLIDDDPAKRGLRIHGVSVVGGRDRLEDAVRRLAPDEVLVAIPSATLATLRAIVASLAAYRVPIKTLPNLRELPECHVELAQIRSLAMEDLLPRPAVDLGGPAVRALLAGRCVLVTGAGGSIGSELCRQILRCAPTRLVALDRNENALFWLLDELRRTPGHDGAVVPALLDVTSESAVERLFAEARPDVVFHAAAYKHVPLLEHQVAEAVRNNVFGTLAVARAAERHGAARFVLISTDKAVLPVSVMGATKRLCELIVQVLMKDSPMRCCAVRFGNVLGSNGSVVQVWLRQIKAGGPVTVTDPAMQRYFMLVSEAIALVQHAAAQAAAGTVYVLDMGDPIRIGDLARHVIGLTGYRPDVDVPIVTTGARPGERLVERLVAPDEILEPCPAPGLRIVSARSRPSPLALLARLGMLQRLVDAGNATATLDLLMSLARPDDIDATAATTAVG
jgi:FlaA1/EpsC-like NDP-sugar epimerase